MNSILPQARRAAALVALTFGCAAQEPSTQPSPDAGPDPPPLSVEIGIPGGPDGLDYTPFPESGELRLETFGQGGTHILLAIRCSGFGNRAYVGLALTNLETGMVVSSPAPVRPQLLACSQSGECDLVPILAMATGITAPDVERNGLHIEVAADVHNDAGLATSATREGILSTADL